MPGHEGCSGAVVRGGDTTVLPCAGRAGVEFHPPSSFAFKLGFLKTMGALTPEIAWGLN
jgi:hypothetical protein